MGNTNLGSSIGRITTSGVVTHYTGTGMKLNIPLGLPQAPTEPSGSPTTGTTRSPGSPPCPGDPLSIVGRTRCIRDGDRKGYQPGEEVAVTYRTGLTERSAVSLCATTAAIDGTFSCSGDVPSGANAGADGNHKIKAKGTSSLAEATTTFTLT